MMPIAAVNPIGRRRYHGGCAVAHALDILGNRWTIPIIKELLFGGMRFSGLKARLPGIGPNVLTQRLVELEEEGLVRQRQLSEPVPANIYELTERGHRARPLIVKLARWAAHSPGYEAVPPLSAASLLILLEASLDPIAAAELDCLLGLTVGQDNFVVAIEKGHIGFRREKPQDADATISGSALAICQLLLAAEPLEHLKSKARIRVTGDIDLVRRLPDIFRRI